jgi:hypothetical protein
VYSDTWEWDGNAWTERKVTGASGRTSPHMAAFNDRIILFGGNSLQGSKFVYFSDTWEWNGNAWNQSNASGPAARTDATMATR